METSTELGTNVEVVHNYTNMALVYTDTALVFDCGG